ncbi:MAG: hypothetical protein K5770_14030 [Lachnospiraceae bacterium]|nr:hypothetical protein [Lachnospiraceae bacterium]
MSVSGVTKTSVINALRLSAASAIALDTEIDRNIFTARAELKRAGCTDEIAESENELVISAIVAYCQMNMGSNDRHQRYLDAWLWQVENIRKSTIEVEHEE